MDIRIIFAIAYVVVVALGIWGGGRFTKAMENKRKNYLNGGK